MEMDDVVDKVKDKTKKVSEFFRSLMDARQEALDSKSKKSGLPHVGGAFDAIYSGRKKIDAEIEKSEELDPSAKETPAETSKTSLKEVLKESFNKVRGYKINKDKNKMRIITAGAVRG